MKQKAESREIRSCPVPSTDRRRGSWDQHLGIRGECGCFTDICVGFKASIHLQRRRPRFDPWVGKIP